MEEVHILQGIKTFVTHELQQLAADVNVQLVLAQHRQSGDLIEGKDTLCHGETVAVKADFGFLCPKFLVLIYVYPTKADGFLVDRCFRQGKQIQTVDEIALGIIPIGNETVGNLAIHTLQLLGGQMPYLQVTLTAGYQIVMAFKGGKTAAGADVQQPLQKFRILFVAELPGDTGFIHPKLLLNQGRKLSGSHVCVLLRLDDPTDITAHFTLADNVAPTGVDTVAILNAENRNGQPQLFDKGGNGRLHIYASAVEGAVSLRGNANRAALTGDFDAVLPAGIGAKSIAKNLHRYFMPELHPSFIFLHKINLNALAKNRRNWKRGKIPPFIG